MWIKYHDRCPLRTHRRGIPYCSSHADRQTQGSAESCGSRSGTKHRSGRIGNRSFHGGSDRSCEYFGLSEAADNLLELTSSNINSLYAVLLDVQDNTILAQRDADHRMYPASMTKIMTVLVAVENIQDMDETVTMTYDIIAPLVEAEASVPASKRAKPSASVICSTALRCPPVQMQPLLLPITSAARKMRLSS